MRMKRALFDTSFLVAFFDHDHNFHDIAVEWYGQNQRHGWATCPITQNGFLRILSGSKYSSKKQYRLTDVLRALHDNSQRDDHEFWADDISLLDDDLFRLDQVLGPKQLTDVYLLGLAIKNGGRLVTFDRKIPISSVKNAKIDDLVVV